MKSYQRFQCIGHTDFNTSGTNAPRLLSRVKAGTHSPFGEKSHTRAHTAKQGRFGWGRYHYPRHKPHVHEHPRAGCQNGKLCRFWGLVVGAPKERREPSGQRCAHARHCSEASRPCRAAYTYAANISIFPAEFFSQSQKTGKKSYSLIFCIHVFDRTA